MKKRIISILMSIFLLFVGVTPVFAEQNDNYATRREVAEMLLNAADDYNPDVKITDIIKGDENGQLNEDSFVTRAEALVMLERAFGDLPTPKGQNERNKFPGETFNDIPQWAETELADVFDAGIVAGTAENTFSPDAYVTADQMNLFIKRVYALFGTNLKDDFYETVNKKELEELKIPQGYSCIGGVYSVAFKADQQVNSIIKDIVASEPENGTKEQKIKDLYKNVINTEARNELGIKPIQKYLDAVDSAQSINDLIQLNEDMDAEIYTSPFYSFAVGIDAYDSSKYSIYFAENSHSLSKDNYKDNDIIDIYKKYLTEIFTIVGDKTPSESAQRVIEYETKLSEVSLDPEDDGNKTYNILSLEEITAAYPRASNIFEINKMEKPDEVIVEDMGIFKKVSELLNDESNLETFKAIMKYYIVSSFENCLSTDLADASKEFEEAFYGSESVGIEDDAMYMVEEMLEQYISELYAEKYFSAEKKADLESMTKDIINYYRERIENIDWMSEAAKKMAVLKLDNIKIDIGYPDSYPNYLDDVSIVSFDDGSSLYENVIEVSRALHNYTINLLNGPVNKDEWSEAVFVADAYYNQSSNSIIFPAAFLQEPLYDPNASYETNLGGIGYVIGHEITHAFDNVGANYDENGNVADWWTEEDKAAFNKLCDDMAAYYDGQETAPGITESGEQTLFENIADNGSAMCITEIASKLENPNYKELFESMARCWAMASSREYMEYLKNVDVHSFNKIRVNRVLQNNQIFYDTYGIKEGDGMWVDPKDRVEIW